MLISRIGAGEKRPAAEPRTEACGPCGQTIAVRDERAFLRNGTGAVVRGFGRTAAGEVEQESALVTPENRNRSWAAK
jgi:hypothetical protein